MEKRDPIGRLATSLITSGALTTQGYESLVEEVKADISEQWERALNSPYPKNSALFDLVYKGEPQ